MADFGIIFAADAEFTSSSSFTARAMGVGTDGMYAIRLNNIKGSMFAECEKVYAQAYAGSNALSDEIREIEISATAE